MSDKANNHIEPGSATAFAAEGPLKETSVGRASPFQIVSVLVAVMCMAFSGVQSGHAQERPLADYSVDELKELYLQITFRLEGGGDSRRLQRLAKWSNDDVINVYPIPQESLFNHNERYRQVMDLVAHVISEISAPVGDDRLGSFNTEQMTSLVIDETTAEQIYLNSVTVYVGTREKIKVDIEKHSAVLPIAREIHQRYLNGAERSGSPLCFGIAIPQPFEPPVLRRASVFIEDTPEIETCIYEELMQTFGLFNDFPAGTPSVFNDDNVFDRPTDLDWLLWKVHFDERLEAGMSKAEVRQVLPEILSEILPHD